MNDRKWKRTRGSYLLYAACLGLLLSLAPTAVQGGGNGNPNPEIFPPTSHPYGLTYGEWSVEWFTRFMETPVYDYPSDCTFAETRHVLFLRASAGEPVEYTCTVPPGKSLLFPIIAGAQWCPDFCDEETTIEDLRAALAAALDELDPETDLEVDIDGVSLGDFELYRFTSPVFSAYMHPDSTFGLLYGEGLKDPVVADGYWMMVHPLPPGEHVIHYRTLLFGLDFDTTIYLTVAPPGHDD